MIDPRLASALEAQLERRRARLASGERHVGWKLGLGDRERLGEGPVPGYLTSATQLADGDAYAVPAEALHADAEVAVEIGAGGAIAGYAPALELVDLAGTNDPEAIVAANLWHRAFALGPWRAALPPGDVEARLVVNGEVRAQGVAAADLAPRIDALGRILDAAGERLRPGDVVITGGVVQVPVTAGDEVVAELRPLGRVRLRVSPPSAAA